MMVVTSATPLFMVSAARRCLIRYSMPFVRSQIRTMNLAGFSLRNVSEMSPSDCIADSLLLLSKQQRREASNEPANRTRRRRKGSASPRPVISDEEEDGRAVHHPRVSDINVFRREADRCLAKIAAALKPMALHNDVFIIDHSPRNAYSSGRLTLTLSPDEGVYSLEVDDAAMVIYFQTPLSGKMVYMLSARTNEWVSQDDGHSFEGLLVRDLIRHCNGLPDL